MKRANPSFVNNIAGAKVYFLQICHKSKKYVMNAKIPAVRESQRRIDSPRRSVPKGRKAPGRGGAAPRPGLAFCGVCSFY